MSQAEWKRLVEGVRRDAPFATDRAAEHAIEATVAVLGAALRPHEREDLAPWLPGAVRPLLHSASYAGDLSTHEMIDLVRREESTGMGWAREHVIVVCEALGREIGFDGRVWLSRHLGPEWSELFDPESERDARPEHVRPAGRRSTLAEGRQGSNKPIAGRD